MYDGDYIRMLRIDRANMFICICMYNPALTLDLDHSPALDLTNTTDIQRRNRDLVM